MSNATACMWMRGGTSKGGYFLAQDLPADPAQRDAFLLRIMGSPDRRQIDGMGGADPLTSKVAVIQRSNRPGIDIDYLFLQVYVDQALVSDAQNCGNILAGVGPFAIERGLVTAGDGLTHLTIYMENTGQIAIAEVQTPEGQVNYQGNTQLDGVPGSSAPVLISFSDTAGSSCGALLPTGNAFDTVDGHRVTLIDNGMPCVLLRAKDFGLTGAEGRSELDANSGLKARLEAIRLQAGYLMNLGDVTDKTVPKMTLISAAQAGGAVRTQTFIPHRAHASIGVLGAVSVATACAIVDSVAHELAQEQGDQIAIEHPSGSTQVALTRDAEQQVSQVAMVLSARKLMDGQVFS